MEKALRVGGKAAFSSLEGVLIKAVVQAIPTYTMICFKLSVGLCEEIKGLIQKFW